MVVAEDKVLGEYTLHKLLGQGAFGDTFLASHHLTGRFFTIKILPQELSHDAEFLERLKEEARVLGVWNHPHIAKIHTVSESAGVYFIVSDLIDEGKAVSLKEFLKVRSLKEDEILELVKSVASALDYIHAHHTWHGGLKLSNVLLTEKLECYVTDPCLSRMIGEPRLVGMTYHAMCQKYAHLGFSSETERYSEGPLNLAECTQVQDSFVEGFSFLAPEYKKLKNVGPSVDVYALGVLAYYLLMGTFPEVSFQLPAAQGNFKYNWDGFVLACLKADPLQRPTQLSRFLAEILPPSARKVEGEVYGFSLKPVIKTGELKKPSFEPDPGAIFQTETVVGKYVPELSQEKKINPIATDMVVIPEGQYLRGSKTGNRDELVRHAVFLSPFAIDKHPVTNEQFVCFLEAMGGEKDGNNNDMIRLRDSRIKRSAGKISIESGYAKHPVVGVSWYGALAYAKWVGKRLPTEAEWEVASYGGHEDFIYPTGPDIERSHANFFSSDTTPVMSYPPNGYGLYDMAGNVYEWCEDWYDHHYYDLSVQEPHDPKGPLQGVYRVLRGGCWKSLKEDLRCSHRHRNNPGLMNGTYGFRCAADVSVS